MADAPTQLYELSASELIDAFSRGTVSPVEVVRSVLDRISRWEPHIQATYLLRPDLALGQARASESRWRKHEPCLVYRWPLV